MGSATAADAADAAAAAAGADAITRTRLDMSHAPAGAAAAGAGAVSPSYPNIPERLPRPRTPPSRPPVTKRLRSMEDLLAEDDEPPPPPPPPPPSPLAWLCALPPQVHVDDATATDASADDARPRPDWPTTVNRDGADESADAYLARVLGADPTFALMRRLRRADFDTLHCVALVSPYEALEQIARAPGSAARMRAWMVATESALGAATAARIFLHIGVAGVTNTTVHAPAAVATISAATRLLAHAHLTPAIDKE